MQSYESRHGKIVAFSVAENFSFLNRYNERRYAAAGDVFIIFPGGLYDVVSPALFKALLRA